MMKGVSIESERAAKDDAIKAIKQLDVERGNWRRYIRSGARSLTKRRLALWIALYAMLLPAIAALKLTMR
jgi:hypothetical protein